MEAKVEEPCLELKLDLEQPSSEIPEPTPFDVVFDRALILQSQGRFEHLDRRQIMYSCGTDESGAKLVVFIGRRVPSDTTSLLEYVIYTLNKLVGGDIPYVLIYCHRGAQFINEGLFSWFASALKILPRGIRKSMQKLVIVHPSFWVRAFMSFVFPFVSQKFWKKLQYVSRMEDLALVIAPVNVEDAIPLYITLADQAFGNIFGGTLKEGVSRSKTDLPTVVQVCLDSLRENNAAAQDGIFRAAGRVIEVDEMEKVFNQDEELLYYIDNDSVATLLKRYLRTLSAPVIPFHLTTAFIDAGSMQDPTEGIDAMFLVLQELPKENLKVLEELLRFLCEVMANQSTSQMGAKNLSIVFGPTLLRLETGDLEYMMSNPTSKAIACEFLLNHYDQLFPLN